MYEDDYEDDYEENDEDSEVEPVIPSEPRVGVVRGPFFMSASGHVHRTEGDGGRVRVDVGILFQNVPIEKIFDLIGAPSGDLPPCADVIAVAKNHYYKVGKEGYVSLHRHWLSDRSYLGSFATVYVDTPANIKKVFCGFYGKSGLMIDGPGGPEFGPQKKKIKAAKVEVVEAEATPIVVKNVVKKKYKFTKK